LAIGDPSGTDGPIRSIDDGAGADISFHVAEIAEDELVSGLGAALAKVGPVLAVNPAKSPSSSISSADHLGLEMPPTYRPSSAAAPAKLTVPKLVSGRV
jgi:hypothetical protein